MSVLIPGMEMPKGLGKTITIYSDGMVRVWVNNQGSGELLGQRAVSVPPHGRLIDADALRAKQQEDADLFQGSTAYGDKCRRDEAMNAVANIVNAPTIIPASED